MRAWTSSCRRVVAGWPHSSSNVVYGDIARDISRERREARGTMDDDTRGMRANDSVGDISRRSIASAERERELRGRILTRGVATLADVYADDERDDDDDDDDDEGDDDARDE